MLSLEFVRGMHESELRVRDSLYAQISLPFGVSVGLLGLLGTAIPPLMSQLNFATILGLFGGGLSALSVGFGIHTLYRVFHDFEYGHVADLEKWHAYRQDLLQYEQSKAEIMLRERMIGRYIDAQKVNREHNVKRSQLLRSAVKSIVVGGLLMIPVMAASTWSKTSSNTFSTALVCTPSP